MTEPVTSRTVEPRTAFGSLRVVDIMRGIAALAVVLACGRSVVWWWYNPPVGTTLAMGWGGTFLFVRLAAAIQGALPWLAIATLALFALRLRPPRPPLARLASQPGVLACGVASCFLIAPVGGSIVWVVFQGLTRGPNEFGEAFSRAVDELYTSMADWGYLIGLAVFVAWVVLGAVRGWRAEPNPYDHAGRWIGWAWVILAPLVVFLKIDMALGIFL